MFIFSIIPVKLTINNRSRVLQPSEVEPCAEVVLSSAASRSISAGPKKSTAAAVRRGVGGQKNFFKDSRKKFLLSSTFSDDLYLAFENCNKIITQKQWHRRRANNYRRRRADQQRLYSEAQCLKVKYTAVLQVTSELYT